MSEQEPLLATTAPSGSDPEAGPIGGVDKSSLRARTAERLESQAVHRTVITLIVIDSVCVLVDLAYTLLKHESCSSRDELENPQWLEILAHISLVITTLFLVEIPLQLWAFGIRYFNPFASNKSEYAVVDADGSGGGDGEGKGKVVYGGLHLFDAVVVFTTYVLEVVLKGRERELAGLLILLRLWRLVKLVGGVAVGAGEIREEDAQELVDTKRELEATKRALDDALAQNRVLRKRLGSAVSHEDSADLET